YFALSGTSLRITAFEDDRLAREASVEVPARLGERWLGELADFLAGKRAEPPVVLEPAQVVTTQSATLARPVYKRWWFWTIVGAVVVGGAAAALLAPRGGTTLDLV